MSYDSITCWLRSVEDAREILLFQQQHLQETANTLFSLFYPLNNTPVEHPDSKSTYIPSSQSDTSLSIARTNSTDSLTAWSTSSPSISQCDTTITSTSTDSTVLLNQVIDYELESPSITNSMQHRTFSCSSSTYSDSLAGS
jgi:hypothetical protein